MGASCILTNYHPVPSLLICEILTWVYERTETRLILGNVHCNPKVSLCFFVPAILCIPKIGCFSEETKLRSKKVVGKGSKPVDNGGPMSCP